MTSGIDQNSIMSRLFGDNGFQKKESKAVAGSQDAKAAAETWKNSGITDSEKSIKNQTKNSKTSSNSKLGGLSSVSEKYGNVIGKPSLSKEATSYYESLRKKFSEDYEFVLVDDANSADVDKLSDQYANSDKIVVFIDAAQVEKMTNDEDTRNKMEGIIADAKSQFEQLSATFSGQEEVKGVGMSVDADGNVKYFAVLDKSLAAQRERIEKKQEQAKEEKKASEKKLEQEKEDKKASEKKLEKEKNDLKPIDYDRNPKTETIEATSIDELAKQVNDFIQNLRMSYAFSAEGSGIGGTINLSL